MFSARNNLIQTDGICNASDIYEYPFYYIPVPTASFRGVDLSIRTRRAWRSPPNTVSSAQFYCTQDFWK
jgi:hypothetical protein